ncbi:3-hydroxyacyl-CoA dehydrogenase NAD-binding domain-containing protein [Desulfuromonas sp. AOP6]|uniref:3-hydroxyacyl-CoA dehydrogenase NAD-binding domain-containing protein n=1 Tax=Desulfuromonas sp. AOP6 TaxID=1566351 RepID=UPI001289B590|nr:3-hydroxyacyl-CoA dehydrogenase NAD-binding domain-containing protein [Desulfuromonas sp. AOP6]BCA80353.1 fatty acid oxidation complex subunit alpha [Desulfuromonas sp. AOP6]
MSNKYVHYTVDDGIARVTLDSPTGKVNLLNEEFLQDLEQVALELERDEDLRGAIIQSAKEAGFIAGADIGSFTKISSAAEGAELARRGQEILGLWAGLPIPTVAAIHGHCLGGGTEFALACTSRVLAEGAHLALPEIKLGILPGFGGTQRLPRLVGLSSALDLILSGRTLSAAKALEMGLADDCVAPTELQSVALTRVERLAQEGELPPNQKDSVRAWMLEKNPVGRMALFYQARKKVLEETGGHYPAPLKALEVIKHSWDLPLNQGLKLEAEALGELIITPECRNLVHVFFLSQRPKKAGSPSGTARSIERAGVIGAGVMGAEIAQLMVDKGLEVTLTDIRQESVDKGLARARELFGRKKATEAQINKKMARLSGQVGYDGFSKMDLVVEAVVENMEVKQSVLQELESVLPTEALFATNTSALSVTELQKVAEYPGRVAGLHFFNPVHRMPLVEIIKGQDTQDDTLATLFKTATRLGKTPILVADSPGFLVNRLLGAYLNEACLLAAAGVKWTSVDKQAKEFGLPMGPFRLIDEVGIDVAFEVGKTLAEAFPYLHRSPLLDEVAAEKLLGKKGGKGFYLYQAGKDPEPNKDVSPMVNLAADREATKADWRRLLLLMVNEAGRCLDEKIVAGPEEIDTGMIFGTGFPPFTGGLCRWADQEGLRRLVLELTDLEGTLGDRFDPCDFLKTHERFYP